MNPALDPRTPNLRLRYSNEDMLNLNWERLDQAWGELLAGAIEFPIGDNVFITNNLHVGGDVQIDGDVTVNGTATFHGPVTFDGPLVTIVNDLTVLGNTDLHNLAVDNLTINPGGTFNTTSPVIGNEDIISLDWTKITNKPPGIDTGHAAPIGPAGGDLTDFYPDPHLIPSGVVAGVYGDGTNIPRLTVDAKGRLTTVTLVPFTPGGGGGSPLGPAGGDLTGSYPNPLLITLSPAVPAGTWGRVDAIPQLTVDGKGRVTHATHNVIRPGRDPMPPVYVTRFWPEDTELQLEPNSGTTLFPTATVSTQFTPIASGRGRLHGVVSGFLFNTETNPEIGTLHTCWAIVYVFIDGIQKARIRRSVNLWEPGGAGGHAVDAPMEIPFNIPWVENRNQTHQVTLQVRNYRNYNEIVDPVYPMSLQVEWTHLLIEEDPEPGIGTNSSYLLAGAVPGAAGAGAVVGSWVAVYAFTLPAALAGSWATSKVTSTGSFDIQVNGVTKGQIVWTAGTVASFTFSTPVSVAVGDRVEVLGAAGVTDPTWTLRGLL